MSEHDPVIEELLATALRCAADIAQGRVGKPLQVVESTPSVSTALLRFDVKFDDAASISWFVSNEDATGFSDLLIGGTGDRGAVLTEMHLDALSGVFSDMLERAVEGLNTSLATPLTAGGVDMGMESAIPELPAGGASVVLALQIEGFGLLTIVEQANAPMVQLLLAHQPLGAEATAPAPAAAAADADAPAPEGGQPTPTATGEAPAAAAAQPGPGSFDNVVQLPNLTERGAGNTSDLRMLMNVPLSVTVELGRAERTVRDLLDLSVGSIIELVKLAGDPLDIMVNGKVLARGEVVVIDEEFGIRVTEILSPEQRLQSLG